ncbi:MAG: 23S rRNA (uracil(1939)-C(5))-methyltransferase RlmD [Eubacteriales bacterium]|nr:23S rRNA (uracil(1939)-C(5))-methyltransferase RlmD [Eubacteriales bacterium]
MTKELEKCKHAKKCGGCAYQGMEYERQLQKKQKQAEGLLKKFGKVQPIIGMETPYYYRNKVHNVFDRDRKGNPITGNYEEKSHKVVAIEHCQIEDQKSQEIIHTIRDMLKSFKIKTYDEDTEYGLLRHVLVRRGFATGEIMVVLVTVSPVFPSKNNFVKALRKKHPEITTIVMNINDKRTSMVLGSRNIVLYGKGFIRDTLCGCSFRISPDSFYQVNPVQTEVLYRQAIKYAGLTGKEKVIDAYCGIGTIGLVASKHAGQVIGVELNANAVKDAITNTRENKIKNAVFRQGDAGEFMTAMAEAGEKADVVFMDPPRAGSTETFMKSVVKLAPKKLVYVSCNPETLARDLKYLSRFNYKVQEMQPVDMFPFTDNIESVCLLSRKNATKKDLWT